MGSLLTRYEYTEDVLINAIRKQYGVNEKERAQRDAERMGLVENSGEGGRPPSAASARAAPGISATARRPAEMDVDAEMKDDSNLDQFFGAAGGTAKAMRGRHAALEASGLRVWRCDDQPLGADEARWVCGTHPHPTPTPWSLADGPPRRLSGRGRRLRPAQHHRAGAAPLHGLWLQLGADRVRRLRHGL